jgi:hypothetical protein
MSRAHMRSKSSWRQVCTQRSCTRSFLEGRIRERTLDLPNAELVAGRVTGLVYDGQRVAAVR